MGRGFMMFAAVVDRVPSMTRSVYENTSRTLYVRQLFYIYAHYTFEIRA